MGFLPTITLEEPDFYSDDLREILDSDTYSKLIKEAEAMPARSRFDNNNRDFKFSDLSAELQQKIRAALTTAN